MKKSEKVLMGCTAIAIVAYFGLKDLDLGESTQIFGPGEEAVELAKSDFEAKLDQITEAPKIYREFRMVVGEEADPAAEGEVRSEQPDLEFQRVVGRWCEQIGFPRPDLTNTVEDIDGVEDYQLVLVTVSIPDGDLPRISRLMKLFDQNGLTFHEVELRASRDSERMNASITVGRLAKAFKMTPKRRSAKSRNT